MPETFGSGVSGPQFDTRVRPAQLLQLISGSHSAFTQEFPDDATFRVITNIDVVSAGGGSGGNVLYSIADPNHWFWSINIGSNTDTFSWRGFLVLPAGGNITVFNNSDTTVSTVVSGLIYPVVQIT